MMESDSPMAFEEPPRLIDVSRSQFERALLEAGRSIPSNPDRRLQVLAAVGVGSTLVLSSKTSFAMVASWKKVLVSGAIAGVGATGVVAYSLLPEEAGRATTREAAIDAAHLLPNEPRLAVDERRVDAIEPRTLEQEQVADVVSPEPAREAQSAVEPRSYKRAARPEDKGDERAEDKNVIPRAKVPERPVATLQEEVAALDRARAALRASNPGSALRHLNDYSAEFPRGSLRLEAETLRIEALSASGSHAEASRRAKRILERSPNSVLAARLRRYVLD